MLGIEADRLVVFILVEFEPAVNRPWLVTCRMMVVDGAYGSMFDPYMWQ